MIKGVIFDMDGVLVDTEPFHLEALHLFCREHNLNRSSDDITSLRGKRNEEVLPALFGKPLPPKELLNLAYTKEALFRSLLRDSLKPLPGLLSFLSELKERGIPCAVATSACQENIDFVLQGLDIASYFSAVVGDSDITRGKPYPDPYLCACEHLAIDPEDALVFEDSIIGLTSAQRARCQYIAVATSLPYEDLTPFKPKRIIRDFTEISCDIFFADYAVTY
jgi:beta-phosphoglucomutase